MGRKGDNRSDSARARTRQYKADPGSRPSPVPLENCPWCGTRFAADSFALWPNDDRPEELRIVCTNPECDFSGDRPLPVLAVDEPIYRRLPAFLIATVDKFASLPWEARTGVLLGGADRYDRSGFHGAAEPRAGRRLERPLLPPDLVIQDELHLISGPLGTMVGLYESVIDALCVRAAVRAAPPPRRAARPVPGPQDVLGRGRADVAGVDGPGGRRPPAPGARLSRDGSRGLRHCDQHDLGRPGHSPARPHGRAEPTEDACGVHPGDQPRWARVPASGPGGDVAERAQAARPFALRAVPALPTRPSTARWRCRA